MVEVKDGQLEDYDGDYNVRHFLLVRSLDFLSPFTADIDALSLAISFNSQTRQYYLEKNLDAREKELEREAELEAKAPKVKAKSKMSKVIISPPW